MRDLQPNLPIAADQIRQLVPIDIGRQSDHKFRNALDASFMSLLPSHTHSGSAWVRISAGECLVLIVEMSFFYFAMKSVVLQPSWHLLVDSMPCARANALLGFDDMNDLLSFYCHFRL